MPGFSGLICSDQALPTSRMDSSVYLIEASYSGNFVMQQKHKTQSIANTKKKGKVGSGESPIS